MRRILIIGSGGREHAIVWALRKTSQEPVQLLCVPGNAGIEANARQFVPSANADWEARFPGLFTIREGVMQTGQLTGPGLGAVPARNGPVPRPRS